MPSVLASAQSSATSLASLPPDLIDLVCSTVHQIPLRITGAMNRALLGLTAFVASTSIFGGQHAFLAAEAQGQYLLGLGIGDITGYAF
jgi:hypothetical protein